MTFENIGGGRQLEPLEKYHRTPMNIKLKIIIVDSKSNE